ncbi:MAG: hypothetical protein A4S09_08305 [Proteobacteria bacterium SG_bin7]|nr:MAG: hypothetical protein A4S09_08305 [Proteobacteria bacterium SG_bin7]
MFRNQRGMTLLEILIVLGILGGLMVTVFGQINKQLKKAKIRQAQMQFGQIKSALEQYNADCGDYPPTEIGLNALMSSEGTNCQNWGPEPYIGKKDIKDPWNMDIIYENTGSNFVLKSLGSDKKEGTDDITSGDQADEK